MDKQKVKMTDDERLHFVETIPKLAKVIPDKGELTDVALTRVGCLQQQSKIIRRLHKNEQCF